MNMGLLSETGNSRFRSEYNTVTYLMHLETIFDPVLFDICINDGNCFLGIKISPPRAFD